MSKKASILFGGKNVTVTFEPVPDQGSPDGFKIPPPQEMKVRHIPVREYETGFKFVDDETALVGFLVARDRDWAQTITPESYEEILKTGREENRSGFFSYCQRRTERDQERADRQQINMLGQFATMPAALQQTLVEKGMMALGKSPSPNLSPGSLPPPAR